MKRVPRVVPGCAIGMAIMRFPPMAAAQCAMCRTGLMNSPEGQQLIAGFNSGILLLLAVPLIIFLSVVFLLWRAARKRSLAAQRVPVSVWKEAPSLSPAQPGENTI